MFYCRGESRHIQIPKKNNKIKPFIQTPPLNFTATDKNGRVLIENDIEEYISNTIFSKKNRVEVESITISNLSKKYKIKKINFLEMNIEGAEV